VAFEIKFTFDAAKDVQRLDGSSKRKLKNSLNKNLALDPDRYGTPLRAELVNFYKHEFAARRVIYRIYPPKKLVMICAVGPRKSDDVHNVYNQLGKLVQSGRLAAQIQAVLKSILDP
jgi:mRNA-degrading endonuclease RelE of RelBE toxin-antitoxin system